MQDKTVDVTRFIAAFVKSQCSVPLVKRAKLLVTVAYERQTPCTGQRGNRTTWPSPILMERNYLEQQTVGFTRLNGQPIDQTQNRK